MFNMNGMFIFVFVKGSIFSNFMLINFLIICIGN